MNFQESVLAHMRAKFPDVTFSGGMRSLRPRFDPSCDMDIVWDKERQEIADELQRYVNLHQFRSGLEALSRDLKVIVRMEDDGHGQKVVLRNAEIEDLGGAHTYLMDENGAIAWARRTN